MSFTAFGTMYRAACELMPQSMDTPNARAMLLAISMQESRLDNRRQIGGPARGFWQFELGGIRGVLNHSASRPIIRRVLDRLDYDYFPDTSYAAIEHNDALAFAYARLLLYTLPEALPAQGDVDGGWDQYIAAWRPGKPHRGTWDSFFTRGWQFAGAVPTSEVA